MTSHSIATAEVRKRLVFFLRQIPERMRIKLDELKASGLRNRHRDDFLWYHLITGFATHGNSRGFANLMADPQLFATLKYETLKPLSSSSRQLVIENTFKKAKIRWATSKAKSLNHNLELIETHLGGLAAANSLALSQPTNIAKKAFLMQFKGIGEKYGRNIWMDVYDVDFRQSIAIDERIKKILVLLGISSLSYSDQEQHLREIAEEAGIEAWELDRVCYHFIDDVIAALS